jgi:low affinity Fe/Cu permease
VRTLISNGLSFNAATGTISGTPIASSDPVTYTVTAFGLFFFFSDTATVVIAVGVGIYTTISTVIDNDFINLFLTA